MVNMEIIDHEIIELEKRDTTFATVERLAWLYVVKDHLDKAEEKEARTSKLRGSEFLQACSDVPIELLLSILDEHFDAIRMLYPREYDLVLKRIKEKSLD